MAQVPDTTLSWLNSRLHEYHDPQRTYSDTVHTLSVHPSLSPATEVYTYENGAAALLLTLTGTLPVSFRGTTYHFPVKLWITHRYPHECPVVYVVPGKDMAIRPGQHVGVDGRVYHPYLRDWARMWDRANMIEFLEHLERIFGKEPPVISRAQQQPCPRPTGPNSQSPAAGSAPPQLPPKKHVGTATPVEMPSNVGTPPPLPPKPGGQNTYPGRDVSKDGPPLPPLPHELPQNASREIPSGPQNGQTNGYWQAQRASSQNLTAPLPSHESGRPPGSHEQPPVPAQHISQPQQPHQPSYLRRTNHDKSPVSPISNVSGYSELPGTRYTQQAPDTRQLQYSMQSPPPAGPFAQQQQTHSIHFQQGHPQPFYPSTHPPTQPSQQIPQAKQPVPDLLSDPFDVALPMHSHPAPPAPPIPPNPEKEHLLQAISATLTQQAQQKVNQNLAAVPHLQAQQHALRAAHELLEGELRQLEQLDQVLSNNETILHRSIQECDRTIATAKSKKQPPIDDVLIAPTMVANQLWTLCAEEAACREMMYVLQKAVDKGRVNGNDFVRQMRGLGRECFLKMALARKCARGMGLESQR